MMNKIKSRVLAFSVAVLLCAMGFLVPAQAASLSPQSYPTRTTENDPTNWLDGAPGRFFIDSSGKTAIVSYYTQHKVDTSKKITLSANFTMLDYKTGRSMIGIALQKATGNPSGSEDWIYYSWEQNDTSNAHSYSIHTRKNTFKVSHAAPDSKFGDTNSMTLVLEPISGGVRLSATINGQPFTISSSSPADASLVGKTSIDESITGEYYVSIITYQRTWAYTDGITVTSEVPGQANTKTTVKLGADKFTPQDNTMFIVPHDDTALYAYGLKSINTGAYSTRKVDAAKDFTYEADVSFLKGESWAGLILSRKSDSIDPESSEGAVYILRWYVNTGTIQFVSYNKDSAEDLYNKPVDKVISGATALNEAHKLKLAYTNGSFTVWFDNESCFTFEDPAFTGEWYLGLMANSVNAKFANMAYTAEGVDESTTTPPTADFNLLLIPAVVMLAAAAVLLSRKKARSVN